MALPPLQIRTTNQLLNDFVGTGPHELKILNLIYSFSTNTSVNAQAIVANGVLIAANTADIATNAADIATNTADIATNAADIATNAADIATNASDISTNAGNIATNTSDISTNTSDIALRATTAELDARIRPTSDITAQGIYAAVNYYDGVSTYSDYYQEVWYGYQAITAVTNQIAAYAGGQLFTNDGTTQYSIPNMGQLQGYKLFSQAAAATVDVSATLTATQLIDGLITSTTAATVNMTLPTASDLESALVALYGTLAVGAAIKFKVINIGPSSINIVTNTGWTLVGSTSIGTWFYAELIARRTAANTFTLYRA